MRLTFEYEGASYMIEREYDPFAETVFRDLMVACMRAVYCGNVVDTVVLDYAEEIESRLGRGAT